MTRDELAERMRTAECACTHAASSHTMSGCHLCACPLSLWQVRANALLPLIVEERAAAAEDVLERAAQELRDQGALAFDARGVHDVRGAALWDAGCHIDPRDGGAVIKAATT